jgi:anti-sigma B factor antagonist
VASSTDVCELAGWTVVTVTGELDIYAAPRLRGALVDLVQAGTHRVVVDTSNVTFIDSTGIGVLIGALKRLRAADGELRVVASAEPVLRMLRVTGLHRVFATYSCLDEAVAPTTDLAIG